MSIKKLVEEMYDMLSEGKFTEAFEKYYHEDVVMIEGDGTRREGKKYNQKVEQEFLDSIVTFHGLGTTAITSNFDTNISMVETWLDVTYKDGERLKIEQVARQTWKGDKIIEERFYYNQ